MNILEQLPRLCSPTICGTLSQPTTKSERMSCGADLFEWSLEQRAILSPANITTEPDGADDWHNVASEMNPSWRQQESDMFFSQRTIAPSPLTTPSMRTPFRKRIVSMVQNNMVFDEDDEEETAAHDHYHCRDEQVNENEHWQEAGRGLYPHADDDDDDDDDYDDDGNDDEMERSAANRDEDEDEEFAEEEEDDHAFGRESDANLLFSPTPLKSSQTQQTMDVFSPDTFDRIMEDENTLQSTPKTTGPLVVPRMRSNFLD